MKICPFCGEEIKDKAVKCRFCHEFLNDEGKKPEEQEPRRPQEPQEPQPTPSPSPVVQPDPSPPPVSPPRPSAPSETTTNINISGVGDEIVKASYGMKRYTGKAFLAMVLYYLGFFVFGLIANIVFLADANKTKKVIGKSPPGRGCLIFILWYHIIGIIILIAFLLFGSMFAYNTGKNAYRNYNTGSNKETPAEIVRSVSVSASEAFQSSVEVFGGYIFALVGAIVFGFLVFLLLRKPKHGKGSLWSSIWNNVFKKIPIGVVRFFGYGLLLATVALLTMAIVTKVKESREQGRIEEQINRRNRIAQLAKEKQEREVNTDSQYHNRNDDRFDDGQGNDKAEDAVAISPGVFKNLILKDGDWFKVKVRSGQKVHVNLSDRGAYVGFYRTTNAQSRLDPVATHSRYSQRISYDGWCYLFIYTYRNPWSGNYDMEVEVN